MRPRCPASRVGGMDGSNQHSPVVVAGELSKCPWYPTKSRKSESFRASGPPFGQMRVEPYAGSMLSHSEPELGDSQRLSNATLIAPDAACSASAVKAWRHCSRRKVWVSIGVTPIRPD